MRDIRISRVPFHRAGPAFTLVEVILVLAIVAIAMLPMAVLYRGQSFQTVQAGGVLRAHALLLELAATAEAGLYASRFRRGAFTEGPVRRNYPWGDNGSEIEVEQTVSVAPSADTTGLWEISCTVRWTESRGGKAVPRKRNLVRLVADPSPEQGGGARRR